MQEFLVPENMPPGKHYHNPYEERGARSIMRRFSDDVIHMLDTMKENHEQYQAGKTMLSQSPLAQKVWVAAAMKTLGFVEEKPSKNGSCALVLTEKAISQMANLKRFL